MGLKEVAGVFSRRFIVGFFIPSFFVVLGLTQLVDQRTMPAAYLDASGGAQILIVGGFALIVGLLLSGLHYSLLRFLEGYWLISIRIVGPRETPEGGFASGVWHARDRALDALDVARRRTGERMKARWTARRALLVEVSGAKERSPERTAAATELNRRFPAPERLLPTKFGNVIRSFETHPRSRYHLDGIAIWPRLSGLLAEGERSELDDATTDVAFWVNGLTLVTIGGAALFLERLWHRPGGTLETIVVELAVIVVTTLLVWFMYRQAVSAAIRWGDPVRAAFDVHRFELYSSFGVRRPVTESDDKVIGEALARSIWFGEPIRDELRSPPPAPEGGSAGGSGNGLPAGEAGAAKTQPT